MIMTKAPKLDLFSLDFFALCLLLCRLPATHLHFLPLYPKPLLTTACFSLWYLTSIFSFDYHICKTRQYFFIFHNIVEVHPWGKNGRLSSQWYMDKKTSNNPETDRWSLKWRERAQALFHQTESTLGFKGPGPTLSLLPSEPVAVLPCNLLPPSCSTRHWLVCWSPLSSETLIHIFKQPVFSCSKDKQSQSDPIIQSSVNIVLV